MPDTTRFPFESATELREAHTRLLKALEQQLGEDSSEEEESGVLANIEPQIRQFLERGAATGVYLDEVKNRTECQVLLDYWVSSLSRAGLPVSGVRLAKFDELQLPDLKDKDCPYVGLEAFRNQDFFFGREADAQVAVAQVRASPLVVVLGASGSGKSSLVMGGVLPGLAALETAPVLRIVPIFVPGNVVLENLVDAVLRACGGVSRSISVEVDCLRQDPSHLSAIVGGAEAPPTLITIDQFEEVFTLNASADREALVANLFEFLRVGREHRVILTMREEFRNKIVELTAVSPYLNSNKAWYSMRPMGYEELRAAVENPAALVNLQFQTGIVDDLVKKVLGQPAALPLLQFTLRELWRKRDRNRITWEVYEKVGDPLNALQSSADQFYKGLARQTRDEVRRVLLELVRVDEFLEAYRQPVPKSKLIEVGKANTEEVLDLLEANDYVRIARKTDELEAIVEIKHESLIRNWPRFVDWIDDKRRERRQRFALAQAAERWEKSGRPREGLLTGWQLEQAERQSDLSNPEKEFIDASAKAIEHIQRRNQRILIGSFGLLLTLIVGVWAFDHFHLQEWRRTWGELDFLRNMTEEDRTRFAENRLDNVAIYLWDKRRKDPSALDNLVQILREADQRGLFKPDIYKVTEWGASENSIQRMSPAGNEATMITLEHAKGDALSAPMLQLVWREFSQYVWDGGFPIPAKITVAPRDDGETSYRVKVMQLELPQPPKEINDNQPKAPGTSEETEKKEKTVGKPGETMKFVSREEARDLELTYDRSEVLLSDIELDPAGMKLLEKYKSEWNAREPFKELNLSSWWWVPRWTIPIWKAAGHKQFYPPEVSAVVHAVVTIRQQPELIFSDGFVAGVLGWQESVTPETVRAACESSGGAGSLINRTKSWLARKYPLSRLQYLLESMATGTERRPTLAGEGCDLYRAWRAVSEVRETAFFAQELDTALTGAIKPEPPLRVHIASNLQRYIAPSGTLDENVLSRIDELRKRISRDLGFRIPGVRFTGAPELDAGQFTIEVRGQTNEPRFQASPGREIDDILERLYEHLIRTRMAWIDLEEVGRLIGDLPPNLKDWVSKSYSLADLKFILREVLGEDGSKEFGLGANEAEEQLQVGATLTHFSWLIRSLVFWKQACKPSDYACLGDGLRKTQQARLSQPIEGDVVSQVPTTFSGIGSLLADRFDEASTQFNQRFSASNHVSAIREFTQGYGKVAAQTEYREVEKACSPGIGSYSEHEILVGSISTGEKIIAFLDEYGHALPEPMQRRIELCKISSQSQQAAETLSLRESVDHQFGLKTIEWNPNEKYWLSYLALKTHLDSDQSKDKALPPHLEEVKKLISETIRDLPLKEADWAFGEINELCAKPTAGAWCLQMLTGWPQLRPDSYWIPLGLAYASSQLNRQGAYLALELLDRAEGNLRRVEKKRRPEQLAWLAFTRGLAHQALADLGVEGERDKAIQYFRGLTEPKLLRVKNGPGADWIYATLAGALGTKGDLSKAWEAIRQGKKLTKGSAALAEQEVAQLWSQGKFDEALEHLKDKSDDASLFMRCLSRMLVRNPTDAEALRTDINAFLKSSHDYRDYVRLVYYWNLMREGKDNRAKKLLEDRWKEINPLNDKEPPSWKVRLTPERGDYMAVWREMLIGYYLGKVPKEKIFDLMENASNFEASPFIKAEQSRQGFLCEWYFYDAMFQSIEDDRTTRGSRLLTRLEKAVGTNQMGFHEYSFAKDLIRRIGEGEDLTPHDAGSDR